MIIGIVAATLRPKSLEFDLTVIGICSFVTALVMVTSLFLQRQRTSSWDDLSPLKTDVRSNMMRAYRASAKLSWPTYCAIGFGVLGALLLLVAGILQLFR